MLSSALCGRYRLASREQDGDNEKTSTRHSYCSFVNPVGIGHRPKMFIHKMQHIVFSFSPSVILVGIL